MMNTIDQFTRELHGHIDRFEGQMKDQLYESQVPDLLSLRKDVATLRLEVRTLAKIHIPVIPLVIPSFTQPLPILSPLIFDIFIEEDEDQTIEVKKGHEQEKQGDSDEFRRALK